MIDNAEEARRISEIAMQSNLKGQMDFAHEYIHMAAESGKFEAYLNNEFWQNISRRLNGNIQLNDIQKKAIEQLKEEGFTVDTYYYDDRSYSNSYTIVSW